MFLAPLHSPTAAELRERLSELSCERAHVLALGTSDPGRLVEAVAELDDEIDALKDAYVGTAVIELATLRAELDNGPLEG
jgi:hypothetical protein